MGGCLGKEGKPVGDEDPKKEEVALKTSNGASPAPVNNKRASARKSVSEPRAEVTHKSGSVESKFEVGKELGRGGFSIVKEGVDRSNGEKVAIKFIEKKYVDQEELKLLGREIDIMKKVQHRNVLRLIEIYETDNLLSLVMELVNGGELFYKIVDKGSYSEREARDIIRQLVEGVDYLHSKGIAHRDLKPENLLCSENEEGVVIKIADFGLSKAFANGSMLETHCGTPDYAAPEVLRMEGTYDKSVDLWSMGVITYVVLCGFPPFYGKTQANLFEKILNADYDFPDPEWTNISEEAKDFIKHLLVLDVDKRYTTRQCLDHPWLKMGNVGLAGNINVTNQEYIKNYERIRKAGPAAAK
jgi:calcium/calmodulin-dependent protein kinase I